MLSRLAPVFLLIACNVADNPELGPAPSAIAFFGAVKTDFVGCTLDGAGVVQLSAGRGCLMYTHAVMPADAPSGMYSVTPYVADDDSGAWDLRYHTPGGSPFPWSPALGEPTFVISATAPPGATRNVTWFVRMSGEQGEPYGLFVILAHVNG